MLSGNKQAAQETQGMQEMWETGLAGGPRPVGEPLFAAYKMDVAPDECDVMTKLRAKFVQYEEEDQQAGYVRSFLYPCPELRSWEVGASAAQPLPGRADVPLTNKPKAKADRAWLPRRAVGEVAKTFYDFMGVWRRLPGMQR